MTADTYGDALRPLAEALLSAADADAALTRRAAAMSSATVLADARRQADEIRAEARRQGAADAEAALAAARARARREARSAVLGVQRDLYDQLRERSYAAVAALRLESGYARLRSGLAEAARQVLGPDAVVVDADTGGVTSSADGRRLDLSLAQFADRAVDEVAWRLFDPAADQDAVATAEAGSA
ncbi:hypothetical protein AB0H43_03745 [Hamadaea sp. NPDC050747]|uniref:hypothetical protein n=1 Tax=Hamadaea sp. NPDC050747 TaxID=3155789 RepID=UPI0033F799A4